MLNSKDVESAERLARTATPQPITNGTRTSNQTTRRRNILPDTSRDTGNKSRLLFPSSTQTTNRIHRRPGPPRKIPDVQGRRTTNPAKKERIPSPRTILQQL